jgi:hypothetical protein
MLKQSEVVLPRNMLLRIETVHAHLSDCGKDTVLDTRALFNNLVSLVVNALRIAFPTKHELLFIIYALLARYIEPALSALEAGMTAILRTSLHPVIFLYLLDSKKEHV